MKKMHNKRRGGKTMKRVHRRMRYRGGSTGPVCGPVAPQAGAACNASSGANYAEVMVGDAVAQMRRSASSMLA